MNKAENKLARDIVDMLIWRKRRADRNVKWVMENLAELSEEILMERLTIANELYNTSEVARRMVMIP